MSFVSRLGTALLTGMISWSPICIADSSRPLEGVTADGWKVIVLHELSENTPPGEMLIVLSRGDGTKSRELHEICTLTFNQDVGEFFCSAAGKSPLAGVRYRSQPIGGQCDIIFTCVSGCNDKAIAPKRLVIPGSDCE